MDENRIDETRKYEENGFAVEPESGEIVVEGLTVEEAGKVKEIWKRFIRAYKESDGDQEEFLWLEKQLKEELPKKSGEEIQRMKKEIVDSIREFDADLHDLTASVEKEKPKKNGFLREWRTLQKGLQSMPMEIT